MNQQVPTQTTRREVTLGVTGMSCVSCVRRIKKALAKLPGVHEASVNLATEKAKDVYDPDATSYDQLKAAAEKAGYGVRDRAVDVPSAPPKQAATEVTLPIEGMSCASCVRRIEKSLAKISDVREASVNPATGDGWRCPCRRTRG